MSYEANWESLSDYSVPEWFKDAKFGIFIHWGPFSVPAFGGSRDNPNRGNGVWYPYWMYRPGSQYHAHHVANWGDPGEFGYKDFCSLLKGERFDPTEWIRQLKQAGARYIVPVADFSDGFPMFDCSHSGSWTAVHRGPKRDVIGELARESRKEGLKFGASSHRALHWHWYPYCYDFDTLDPGAKDLYGTPHRRKDPPSQEFLENWCARTHELVEKYDLDLIWFDRGWETQPFDNLRPEFIAWFYTRAKERDKEVVLLAKGEVPTSIAVLDIERGGLADLQSEYWQTDTSVSKKSWCYDQEDQYKTPKQIVDQLVDVVSKNGNLLLNVGPKADGTIPDEHLAILNDIGKWLAVNGEAIYGTRPWYRFGEGDAKWYERDSNSSMAFGPLSDSDAPEMEANIVRYTTKDDRLYAIVMGWTESGKIQLRHLHTRSPYAPGRISSVSLLGSPAQVKWDRTNSGLTIVPSAKPKQAHAYAFKIGFAGKE